MGAFTETRWGDLAVNKTPASGPRLGLGESPLEVGGTSAAESAPPRGGLASPRRPLGAGILAVLCRRDARLGMALTLFRR